MADKSVRLVHAKGTRITVSEDAAEKFGGLGYKPEQAKKPKRSTSLKTED